MVDKAIVIDQSPIGRTPRSNPATYTGAFGPIRDLFSQTKLAKEGDTNQDSSPSMSEEEVRGMQRAGSTKLEMNFLPDVWVTCEVCKGKGTPGRH